MGELAIAVAAALREMPAPGRFVVAASGGLDSSVLLRVMAELAIEQRWALAALHVNHALHVDARRWEGEVERMCATLRIPFEALAVQVDSGSAGGLEAAARRARYEALATRIGPGDVLLTAHHLDDQAETLLLALLRGSGPRGLAGMPRVTRFAGGWHGRPLLALPRSTLRSYAEARRLAWVEDPSNHGLDRRRNFLRHQVLPRLSGVWPGAASVLGRAAQLQAEASAVLDEVARSDLRLAGAGPDRGPRVDHLDALGPARAANAVCVWIADRGLPRPGRGHVGAVLAMARARVDSVPEVRWPGVAVRRYRDRLFAAPGVPAVARWSPVRWGGESSLELPHGVLAASPALGKGIARERWVRGMVEVRPRQGGERCRPRGRGVTKRLKDLYRELGVPPWERAARPLVFIDGSLAALPGLVVCEPFAAVDAQPAVVLSWNPRR